MIKYNQCIVSISIKRLELISKSCISLTWALSKTKTQAMLKYAKFLFLSPELLEDRDVHYIVTQNNYEGFVP